MGDQKMNMYEQNTLSKEIGAGGFQWWYFDAEFYNGYSTTLVILPQSIGIIDGFDMEASDPVSFVTITNPEGFTHTVKQEYAMEDLRADNNGLNAQLGSNRIRFDGKSYILSFAEKEISADLLITPVLPPWSPLGEDSRLDEDIMEIFGLNPKHFFDYVAFMPRGTAEGVLRIKDRNIEVMGTGYHEQGYGNFHLGEMMDTWFWSKYYFDEYTLIFAGIQMSGEHEGMYISGVMLGRENEIIVSHLDLMQSQVKIKVEDEARLPQTGEAYPTKISVCIELDNFKLDGKINFLFLRDAWGFSYPEGSYKPRHKPTWLQYTSEIDFQICLNGKSERRKTRGVYEVMLSG